MSDTVIRGRELSINLNDVHGYLLLGRIKYLAREEMSQEKSTTLNYDIPKDFEWQERSTPYTHPYLLISHMTQLATITTPTNIDQQ